MEFSEELFHNAGTCLPSLIESEHPKEQVINEWAWGQAWWTEGLLMQGKFYLTPTVKQGGGLS